MITIKPFTFEDELERRFLDAAIARLTGYRNIVLCYPHQFGEARETFTGLRDDEIPGEVERPLPHYTGDQDRQMKQWLLYSDDHSPTELGKGRFTVSVVDNKVYSVNLTFWETARQVVAYHKEEPVAMALALLTAVYGDHAHLDLLRSMYSVVNDEENNLWHYSPSLRYNGKKMSTVCGVRGLAFGTRAYTTDSLTPFASQPCPNCTHEVMRGSFPLIS